LVLCLLSANSKNWFSFSRLQKLLHRFQIYPSGIRETHVLTVKVNGRPSFAGTFHKPPPKPPGASLQATA
jgi:hypothetical protein